MKITFFSTQPYDRRFFNHSNSTFSFDLEYLDTALNEQTVGLIRNADVVCAFVNDSINADVLRLMREKGVRILALRCAGFNNVDLKAARENDIRVVRVPAYSPHAVAEHAVAMIMTLNRKTHKAYNRIREQNFSLEGLLGFDLYGKTIGVVGTGNIGKAFCSIMKGFGCRVLAYDIRPDSELTTSGVEYVSLETLLRQSEVVSLHTPLTNDTRHLVNESSISLMKEGAMLINTSRGGLIDTKAVIKALKSGRIGALGIDVYEQEEKLFFRDLSETIIEDDVIARLMSFPNVLVTAHQGFFTREALTQIANTTLANIRELSFTGKCGNEVQS